MINTKIIPQHIKPLFWDVRFEELDWNRHQDFIIQRTLDQGNWPAVNWLRTTLGEPALKRWLLQHQGRGLGLRQLRYWELILDLPETQVNAWLERERQNPWHKRTHDGSS